MRTAITIGAGPAGLTAANHLADRGFAVTLLEARSTIGGRSASVPREGTPLNQGPHALYQGGAARRELDHLGIDPPSWNPTSLTGSRFLRAGDRVALGPGGPRAGLQLTRWLAQVLRGAPVPDEESVAAWLGRTVPGTEARDAAAALVRVSTYVADHDRLSARVAADQLKLALWPGVRYLGPWQGLVDALAGRAEDRGVVVRTRAGVRALEAGADGWIVRTASDELRSDVVVLAVGGPAAARRLLGGTGEDARLPRAPRPAEAAGLDLVLRRLPRRGRRFALGTAEPHYLAVHSAPGSERVVVSVAAYLTPEDRTSGTRERLEQVADLMLPGWREQAITTRHLPRMVVVPDVVGPGQDGLHGRPGVDAAGLPGLALAGDWVGPEGLLVDAALASGRAAAETLSIARPAQAA